MLANNDDADQKSSNIVSFLSDHNATMSHERHIGINECEKIGLKIERMEESQELQDAILSAHHAYMITFSQSAALKIIENHDGMAMILHKTMPMAPPLMPIPMQMPLQLPVQIPVKQ